MTTKLKLFYSLVYICCVYITAISIENSVKQVNTAWYVYRGYRQKVIELDKVKNELDKAKYESNFLQTFGTGNTRVVMLEKSENFMPKNFYKNPEKVSNRSEWLRWILDLLGLKL